MMTIGMLGGMSWESTASYYRLINCGVRERLGGLHSAPLLLASVDFARYERLQREGRWDEIGSDLAELACRLERAGAELLLLATNTMHKVAPTIEAALGVPFLHIADATAAHARQAGLRRLGLLGTRFTMEEAFYRERLESEGDLEVLTPGPADRQEVDRVIFGELCRGDIREASRERFRTVCKKLADKGADAIVAGCTEIGLLIGAGDCPRPLLDTTALHVEAVLDRVLSED